MKKYIYYILPLLALTACTSTDLTDSREVDAANEIRVTTGVGGIAVTRGDGMINNTLAADLSVSAIRLDEAYATNYTGLTAKAATINHTGNVMSFTTPEYYLASGDKTKLIAWYPASGAFAPATGAVTFATSILDGSTDIMCTGFAEGNKTTKIANDALNFKHLLTQIAVKVYTPTANEQTNWGGIQSVTIKSANKDVIATYRMPNATTGDEYVVSFGTTASDLALVKKKPIVVATGSGTSDNTGNNADIFGKDNTTVYSAANALTIPVSTDGTGSALAGYAMFSPFTYTSPTSLNVEVVTVNGGTKSAEIKQSLVAGSAYTVSLKFIANEITPTVKITDWVSGGLIPEIEL